MALQQTTCCRVLAYLQHQIQASELMEVMALREVHKALTFHIVKSLQIRK